MSIKNERLITDGISIEPCCEKISKIIKPIDSDCLEIGKLRKTDEIVNEEQESAFYIKMFNGMVCLDLPVSCKDYQCLFRMLAFVEEITPPSDKGFGQVKWSAYSKKKQTICCPYCGAPLEHKL